MGDEERPELENITRDAAREQQVKTETEQKNHSNKKRNTVLGVGLALAAAGIFYFSTYPLTKPHHAGMEGPRAVVMREGELPLQGMEQYPLPNKQEKNLEYTVEQAPKPQIKNENASTPNSDHSFIKYLYKPETKKVISQYGTLTTQDKIRYAKEFGNALLSDNRFIEEVGQRTVTKDELTEALRFTNNSNIQRLIRLAADYSDRKNISEAKKYLRQAEGFAITEGDITSIKLARGIFYYFNGQNINGAEEAKSASNAKDDSWLFGMLVGIDGTDAPFSKYTSKNSADFLSRLENQFKIMSDESYIFDRNDMLRISEAYINAGFFLNNKEMLEIGLGLAEKTAELPRNKRFGEIRYALGKAYFNLKQYKKAEKHMLFAIENPSRTMIPGLFEVLVKTYYAEGRISEAKKWEKHIPPVQH